MRPEDPILWMADYLRDNNPNTNADAAARAAASAFVFGLLSRR